MFDLVINIDLGIECWMNVLGGISSMVSALLAFLIYIEKNAFCWFSMGYS